MTHRFNRKSVRKSMRLSGYDYSTPGFYFITTMVKNRECVFGEIQNRKMVLNEWGKIVERQWHWLFKQYPYIQIDEYIVMPNHFHGIILINPRNCRDRSRPVPTITKTLPTPAMGDKIKPIHELIGAFKTTSSKYIHRVGFPEFAWQRSFHDRIIRTGDELNRIRYYIQQNPARWEEKRAA